MLKITVNEQQTFEVETHQEGVVLNGQPFEWDLVVLGEGRFHILHNNHSYNAELIEANYTEKMIRDPQTVVGKYAIFPLLRCVTGTNGNAQFSQKQGEQYQSAHAGPDLGHQSTGWRYRKSGRYCPGARCHENGKCT